MTKKILIICMVLIGIMSCNDPYENTTYSNADELPNAAYLDSRTEFLEWVDILKYADMYNAINQASETYTVFAPVNEAVRQFYTDNGVNSIEELAKKLGDEYIKDLVNHHLINDKIEQKTFLMGGRLAYPTLAEDYLTVVLADDINENTSVFIDGQDIGVTEYGNETNNGLIYVLNKVMPPLSSTLYDQLINYPIFKAAVDATGLNTRLAQVYDTITSDLGYSYKVKRNFTLFAVTDEVFNKFDIHSLTDLAKYVNAENNYTEPENELYKYVAYHLISSVHFAEELFTFETDSTTLVWNTYATSQVITTSKAEGINYLNFNTQDSTGILISNEDDYLQTKNGIVYEVDNVMPLFTPTPLTIIWDFCDNSQIESIVNSWGAKNGHGDCYQTYFPYGTGDNTDISLVAYDIDIFDYTYTVCNNNWARVGYHQPRQQGNSSDTKYDPNYQVDYYGSAPGNGAYHYNFLSLNLGYMGKINITTPSILKGKYKVSLRNCYVKELYALASSGGTKVKFSIDNVAVETMLFTNSSIAENTHSYLAVDELFNEITFNETGNHTFSVTLMDARASTASDYHLFLDWLKFEPIED